MLTYFENYKFVIPFFFNSVSLRLQLWKPWTLDVVNYSFNKYFHSDSTFFFGPFGVQNTITPPPQNTECITVKYKCANNFLNYYLHHLAFSQFILAFLRSKIHTFVLFFVSWRQETLTFLVNFKKGLYAFSYCLSV